MMKHLGVFLGVSYISIELQLCRSLKTQGQIVASGGSQTGKRGVNESHGPWGYYLRRREINPV